MLRYNVIANFIGQLYNVVIGLIVVPTYVKYLGAEAYGLIGFFAVLQTIFQLLDIGLTPTISRETARYQGGATDAQTLRHLVRGMEGIFFGIGLIGGVGIILGAHYIAGQWLIINQLSKEEVTDSIKVIAIIIAIRWVSGLYRGVINGFEKFVWLNCISVTLATARYVLVIPVLIYIENSIKIFFEFQLIVAIAELSLMMLKTYQLLPIVQNSLRTSWQWKPLKKMMKFSTSIAFTGIIWILVTQIDKVLLSKMLTLSDYGYFTLGVIVAGGINVLTGPISSVILPRMSRLAAEGDDIGLINLYHLSTQAVAVISLTTSLMIAFFAHDVLYVWTGNLEVAKKASEVLILYALGNAISVLAAFPYYLQYVKGDLKLHVVGNGLFAIFLIPSLIWATSKYGMSGAGWTWLLSNIIYFVVWTPIVHNKFYSRLHARWLITDIIKIVIPIIIGILLIKENINFSFDDRVQLGLEMVISALIVGLIGSFVGSSCIRKIVSRLIEGAK